ncbi:MAG TPA: (2Fe-2S)-binding protein [Syntrophorhabdaceae bacterium]|nr:(2Fe-2S)-binding protein [Syntrophorhabdaceae bacterium]
MNTKSKTIRMKINGEFYEFEIGEKDWQVKPHHTLAYTLREVLGLTGTKISCDNGACGACTVIMDKKAVLSCIILTVECDGKEITTIEGLKDENTKEMDILQKKFIEHNAFQCGFCTPGMIMSSKALLEKTPHPTEEEIKEALSGNFCRCISYYQVIKAVKSAADERR